MALLTRARGVLLAGVAAFAVAVPIAPAVVSPAAAAPVAATASASTTSSVTAEERSTKTSRSARAFAARARKVLSRGSSLKGVPYRYGGTTPRGFDCSGFTSYVYRKAGVKLPRTSSAQRRYAKKVSRANARPGDLVFFHNSSGRVYHVGIYVGGNKTLHSPRPGKRVSTERIWARNVSFGRVL